MMGLSAHTCLHNAVSPPAPRFPYPPIFSASVKSITPAHLFKPDVESLGVLISSPSEYLILVPAHPDLPFPLSLVPYHWQSSAIQELEHIFIIGGGIPSNAQ